MHNGKKQKIECHKHCELNLRGWAIMITRDKCYKHNYNHSPMEQLSVVWKSQILEQDIHVHTTLILTIQIIV